nr:oxysterol-binding protein [Cryptococcus depauperatus CBS 7855]
MSGPTDISHKKGVEYQPSKSRLSTSTSSTSHLSQSTPPSALYNFRLLAALRSEDTLEVQLFLNQIKDGNGDERSKAGHLLGMAIRVASGMSFGCLRRIQLMSATIVPMIQSILNSSNISSPNLPVALGSSATPLHVASEIGRVDIVKLLLSHPMIDDTIKDDRGRTPLECAATSEVASVIEGSRAQLQARYQNLLTQYVSSSLSSAEESRAVVMFLEGPRASVANLSGLDERTGTSLLHEAARRRDLRLVELAVKRGADVFVRDKRNKRVLDGEKNADERIKVFLRQFSYRDSFVEARSDGRPPDLHGFLSKWVNYRSGWRTRWFVLENGVLSYYRNREDESIACRGSMAMAVASLQASSDGTRFELSSKVSSAVPKFIVKSAHRAEIARWVQTIKLNIEFYQNATDVERPLGATRKNTSLNVYEKAAVAVGSLPPSDSFLSPALQRTATGLSVMSTAASHKSSSNFGIHQDISSSAARVTGTKAESISFDKDSSIGSEDEDQEQPSTDVIPHENVYELGILNIKEQIELTQQLVDSIVVSPVPSTPDRGHTGTITSSRQAAVKDALRQSLETLAQLVFAQNTMSMDRERYLTNRIYREVQARQLWEENMLTIATQQAEFEKQLNDAAKNNKKKRRALRQAKEVLAGLNSASLPISPIATEELHGHSMDQSVLGSASSTGTNDVFMTPTHSIIAENEVGAIISPPSSSKLLSRPSIPNIQEAHDAIVAAASDDDEEDTDEFFDAIEQNTLPNLKLYDSIAHPENVRPGSPTAGISRAVSLGLIIREPIVKGTIKEYLARKSLEPYLYVRSKLPIDDDRRPSVSLWSILKSSVGKDLTKISFPVSFNECTSMLQRMAEDMEYDACLTVAASEQDSLRRIAFVGAFAMSNYSSTIGRIAKPFNPLLSQTFEYAIPNRYRYISEQVSHHPPISACYSEAPTWKYYGEVDAQNKFQGRSFEIRPTGVAHAELIIPKSWAKPMLDYSKAGLEYGEGYVAEHYSWKKVTTNVSNFIMGSPIIDHYGDLVVTNHRTGETCSLTFKPRGWRGKDAFEIKGSVKDVEGNVRWDIAGRWDTQLIAREASAETLPLESDMSVNQTQKEYILLWRNSEKARAPFNLTPFAVTLNDIPQGLENYLCPTDCRLRTDQRAFENAEYNRAQGLKTLNEEKQRNTRKLRAEGKLPPHEPQWFYSSTDPDTNERVWQPKRVEDGEVAFWRIRESRDWDAVGIQHIFANDNE